MRCISELFLLFQVVPNKTTTDKNKPHGLRPRQTERQIGQTKVELSKQINKNLLVISRHDQQQRVQSLLDVTQQFVVQKIQCSISAFCVPVNQKETPKEFDARMNIQADAQSQQTKQRSGLAVDPQGLACVTQCQSDAQIKLNSKTKKMQTLISGCGSDCKRIASIARDGIGCWSL